VYQWVEMFCSGRKSVTDKDCLSHLTTSRMEDNVKQVNALVQKDRWNTVTYKANKLNISCGPAYSIKVSAKATYM